MRLRVLTWNLFHGRDAPPDPSLHTLRSRLLRRSERGELYIQVNRDLFDEFAALLADADWDLALLQECPPRWSARLARACGADHQRELTARNWLHPLSGWLAHLNPDLIGSWEGGSNTTLARGAAGGIAGGRRLVIRHRFPERRVMAFSRLRCGICVANLHASTGRPDLAEPEITRAAEIAVEWARGKPLVFGGDLNLRPERSAVFEQLANRLELRGVTDPHSIDHLLVRGLDTVEPARAWPPSERELEREGLSLRLSDHAPLEASYALDDPPSRAHARSSPSRV